MWNMSRKLLVALALTAWASGAGPGAALASGGGGLVREPASVGLGVGLPIYEVQSEAWVPPGFSSDAVQAIRASERNRQMLALHARQHPLRVIPRLWLGRGWLVDFYYRGRIAAEVSLTRAGRVSGVWTGPLAGALYARGDFATEFGVWWVLVPFSVLFLLPFLDVRRPLRLAHLDALAVLSLLVSYLLFDHAQLVAGVWAVYPPLLYLLARMVWIGGLRIRRRSAIGRARAGAAPGCPWRLPVPVLAGGLAVLVIARVALSLADRTVIDVGYASVIGAHQIIAGHPLYFSSVAHGDTYGPIAYLAYVPFVLLFPWHGAWDYLPSAHAASLCFDLVTVLGLVLLGRRLRSGREGLRLGLALAWAWSACPFTLLALMMHSNDGLIAMLSVLGLLALSSPLTRGALVGLAAAAKFAPAALLGLFASGRHGVGRRRTGLKGALECGAAFAAVAAVSIWLFLPAGGVGEFYRQTIGFQLNRPDVLSPWALHPSLDAVKVALEVGALALCALVFFLPRRRSEAQVAALAGAVTIAVQLPAIHWFYYYVVWFVPFVAVAVLAAEPHGPERARGTAPASGELERRSAARREPIAA